MSKACKRQPGHLLTRDERRHLRLLATDLERQLAGARTPEQAQELERQLGSVTRELQYDRLVSPRSKKQKAKGGRL